MMKIPVTALTSAPTSASASWNKSFSAAQHSVKAVRATSSGEVGVLMWTDGSSSGAATLAKLDSAGTTVWGPTDFGTEHGEGTDMQVSTDGTAFVMTGQGNCSGMLCGKLTKVAVSNGAREWTKEFASCNQPNACGTNFIKNECWGLQVRPSNACAPKPQARSMTKVRGC